MALIPAALFVLVLINRAIVQDFSRRCNSALWLALYTGWCVGGVVGVWSGFFFSYLINPRVRVYGAPVPGAFHILEQHNGQEQWVDYITPSPVLFAGSNVLMLALVGGAIGGGIVRLVVKKPDQVDIA